MAALIESLAVSGSFKSTGVVNAGGKVWVLQPGSTSKSAQVAVFSDADGLIAVTQPQTLDSAGRAALWVKGAFSLLIEDSAGAPVRSAARAGNRTAAQVEVENAGYLGTVLSGVTRGSTLPGGRTSMDAILTSLYLSAGGHDAKLLAGSGGTERYLKDHIFEVHVSVKDWGAKGDNATDDYAAINNCQTFVASTTYGSRGGVVFFPPGIYRISQTIAVAGRLKFMGCGGRDQQSVIRHTSGTADAFGLTALPAVEFLGLYIDAVGANTGYALHNLGSNVWMTDVQTSSDYKIGYSQSYSTNDPQVELDGCTFAATDTSGGLALQIGGGSCRAIRCTFAGGSIAKAVQLYSASASGGPWVGIFIGCVVVGNRCFSCPASSAAGAPIFIVAGCYLGASSGATPFVFEFLETASAKAPQFMDVGNVLSVATTRGTEYNVATRASGTPAYVSGYFGLGRDSDLLMVNNVAAAEPLELPFTARTFKVTGNTNFVSICTIGYKAGAVVRLWFTGTPTITHGSGAPSTLSASVYLSGSVALVCAADTVLTLFYDGTVWQEISRKVA